MSLIQIGAYSAMDYWRMMKPHLDPAPSTPHYVFSLAMDPASRMPFIDSITFTGPFVQTIITSEPTEANLLVFDDELTMTEVAEIFSRITERPVEFVPCTVEEAKAKYKMGLEVLESPAFFNAFGFDSGVRGVIMREGLRLSKEGKTLGKRVGLQEWMRGQDWRSDRALGDIQQVLLAKKEVEGKE